MAVAVETRSLLHSLTLCGSSWCSAFRPPLRQAAGRYLPFTLVRCEVVDKPLKPAAFHRALQNWLHEMLGYATIARYSAFHGNFDKDGRVRRKFIL